MNDKELLELAAKAAGYSVSSDGEGGLTISVRRGVCRGWDPLIDDGDAFRLAVKLNLVHGKMFSRRVADSHGGEGDIYASTRRAIVLAAAAIGETLP